MRILLFFLFCFVLPTYTLCQKPTDRLFTNLFENTNVGNLHVFSTRETTPNYSFSGIPVIAVYQSFLPFRLHKKIVQGQAKINAVYSIRGNGSNDFYILNIAHQGAPPQLVLYRFVQQKLKKIKTLASLECGDKQCIQIDTWISDFNGDTRLDLLQKTKRSTNEKEVVKATLFLLNHEGHYQKADLSGVSVDSYRMQEIK